MKKLFLLLIPPFICACSIQRLSPNIQVAQTSKEYNLQIEEAQDQNLLLNVWRSKERHPLYLTDISKVSGSVKRDITVGLGIPFINVGTTAKTVNPSTTLSVNPTFDVNVLYTQDFMRGFLSPISPTIFAYYWRQGWPRELLIDLLVRTITIYDDKYKQLDSIENYPNPDSPKENQDNLFGEWAHFLQQLDLSDCQNTLLSNLPVSSFSDTDTATKAVGAGLIVAKSPDNDDLLKKSGSPKDPNAKSANTAPSGYYNVGIRFPILTSHDENVTAALDTCHPKLKTTPKGTTPVKNLPNKDEELKGNADLSQALEIVQNQAQEMVQNLYTFTRGLSTDSSSSAPSKPSDDESAILAVFASQDGPVRIAKLTLRSPEGVLYYLGELARVEEFQSLIPRACIGNHLQPIFVAYSQERASHPADSEKALDLKNCRHSVTINSDEAPQVFIPVTHDPDDPYDSLFSGNSHKDEVIGKNFPACDSRGVAKPLFNGAGDHKFSFSSINVPPLTELKCNSGHSMHSLSLLSQLIGLQKTASNFPTTPSVKVVNQ